MKRNVGGGIRHYGYRKGIRQAVVLSAVMTPPPHSSDNETMAAKVLQRSLRRRSTQFSNNGN